MPKYQIKVNVAPRYKKYNAVLETLHATDDYIRDDNYKPREYDSLYSALNHLAMLEGCLNAVTYIQRNRKMQLCTSYKIVGMYCGEIGHDAMGYHDRLEIHSPVKGDCVMYFYIIESN